jgi:hypothetical protein
MKQSNKKNISDEFARLRDYGFKVFNFNTKKPLPKGIRKLTDHILISKNYMVYAETKIGTDELDDEQKDLAEKISHLSTTNKAIHYRLIRTLADAKTLVELLLSKQI